MQGKKLTRPTDKQIENMIRAAHDARAKAYAPYSKFKVGAALLSDSGKIFGGCNVENASYGLTICAERAAIYNAVTHGRKRFKALLILTNTDNVTPPCGACRQVISEFTSKTFPIILVNKTYELVFFTISELLPKPFKINM